MRTPKEPARVGRQILIKILQSEEADNIKKPTNESLLTKISQGPRSLLAVNQLTSGDIILHTANESDKAALERDTNWTTKVVPSAKVYHKTYTAIVGISRCGDVHSEMTSR